LFAASLSWINTAFTCYQNQVIVKLVLYCYLLLSYIVWMYAECMHVSA